MKRFILALSALWLVLVPSMVLAQGQVGPINQVICNKSAVLTVATATTTSIVAGNTNQAVFICGWHVTSNQSTTSTFQLEYGTTAGGPCGTPVLLTPAFNVTSTAPSGDHIDYAVLSTPMSAAGFQVCVVSTGATVGLAILIYYSQF